MTFSWEPHEALIANTCCCSQTWEIPYRYQRQKTQKVRTHDCPPGTIPHSLAPLQRIISLGENSIHPPQASVMLHITEACAGWMLLSPVDNHAYVRWAVSAVCIFTEFPKIGSSSKYLQSKPFVVPTESHRDFWEMRKRDELAVVARNLSD